MALMTSYPIAIVIRLAGLSISRSALEQALGLQLDRYEPDGRHGPYAQIDVDDSPDVWDAVSRLLSLCGTQIFHLVETGAISSASLDVAVTIRENNAATYCVIPRLIVEASGRAGM